VLTVAFNLYLACACVNSCFQSLSCLCLC